MMWREDVAWARPFNLKQSNKGVELENLGDILQAGDVVLVELREDEKTPNGAPRPVRVILVQEPVVQAAAIVIDHHTGAIRAMVGGYDFARSKFNRAVQAVRPPGSAFKPVTFSAAISEGWTPSDLIVDAPMIFPNLATGKEWKPTNFGKKFYGPTTLREALTRSRNVVTVKLAHAVGVDKVMARARQLGIRSPLEENLSLALGSSGVTLLELTSLYGALAERGRHVESFIIRHVEGPDGKLLWAASPRVRQAIPPEEAYVSLDLLKNVVKSGTAVRAKVLKRPLAGKTGTTNDFQDAWFVGASPFYSVGVWVGMDDKSTLGQGETGARAALPIWVDITRAVHENLPPKDFGRPPKVTMVYIDPKTGARLPRNVAGGVFQAFVAGTGPSFFPHEPREIDGIRALFREDVSLETEPNSEDTPIGQLSSSP
jgi:penicillin-binding protein 1A